MQTKRRRIKGWKGNSEEGLCRKNLRNIPFGHFLYMSRLQWYQRQKSGGGKEEGKKVAKENPTVEEWSEKDELFKDFDVINVDDHDDEEEKMMMGFKNDDEEKKAEEMDELDRKVEADIAFWRTEEYIKYHQRQEKGTKKTQSWLVPE
ncbi:hypothetical protein AKJ16_DCAP16161 [Drosera capensis]